MVKELLSILDLSQIGEHVSGAPDRMSYQMANEVEELTVIAREALNKGKINNYDDMLSLFAEVARYAEKSHPEFAEWLKANMLTNGEAAMKQIWNSIIQPPTESGDGGKIELYLSVPHKVLDEPKLDGLKTGEWLLYLMLWRYCWAKDRCHPSIGLLARDTRASTKSVERWLYGHGSGIGLTRYRPDGEHSMPLVTVQTVAKGKGKNGYKYNEYVLNYKKVRSSTKKKTK